MFYNFCGSGCILHNGCVYITVFFDEKCFLWFFFLVEFWIIVNASWSTSSWNGIRMICNAFIEISDFLFVQKIAHQNDLILKINCLSRIFMSGNCRVSVFMLQINHDMSKQNSFHNHRDLLPKVEKFEFLSHLETKIVLKHSLFDYPFFK